MIYRVIFDDQWFRTIPACLIDSRVGTPIANQIGNVMQAYIEAKLAQIPPGGLTYKIETMNGVLVAVFVISNTGIFVFSVVRPAFQQFGEIIEQEISSFITGNDWVYDK